MLNNQEKNIFAELGAKKQKVVFTFNVLRKNDIIVSFLDMCKHFEFKLNKLQRRIRRPLQVVACKGLFVINKSDDFVVKMRFYAQCLLILVNFNKMCFLSENSLTQIKKLGRVMSI